MVKFHRQALMSAVMSLSVLVTGMGWASVAQAQSRAVRVASDDAQGGVVPASFRPASVRRPSLGELYGLRDTPDALELKSSVALVVDQDSSQVLYSKNAQAVLPIASLTKLMTGVVVAESGLAWEDWVTITEEDIDTERNSGSRLVVGTTLPRYEMLLLALMSSENRAAHALGRHYPGGLPAFVAAMNRKAAQLGMTDTRYIEPTGLSSSNQSSAPDLARLVAYAHQHPVLRQYTTMPGHEVNLGYRTLQYNNTNRLVHNPSWEIGLQKTGYISEAGRCLVMQTRVAGRRLIMVFLDSAGKNSRLGDAERVRQWLESATQPAPSATTAPHPVGPISGLTPSAPQS